MRNPLHDTKTLFLTAFFLLASIHGRFSTNYYTSMTGH